MGEVCLMDKLRNLKGIEILTDDNFELIKKYVEEDINNKAQDSN